MNNILDTLNSKLETPSTTVNDAFTQLSFNGGSSGDTNDSTIFQIFYTLEHDEYEPIVHLEEGVTREDILTAFQSHKVMVATILSSDLSQVPAHQLLLSSCSSNVERQTANFVFSSIDFSADQSHVFCNRLLHSIGINSSANDEIHFQSAQIK